MQKTGKFYVAKVHLHADNPEIWIKCFDGETCSEQHMFHVYCETSPKNVEWISEHGEEESAKIAANAYQSRGPNKPELNAIIAGLRLLKHDRLHMPDAIFDLFTDGIEENEALTDEQINALCESINFSEIDLSGSPAKVVLDRIHSVLNGKHWDADSPVLIAEILENAGYTIAGPDEEEG